MNKRLVDRARRFVEQGERFFAQSPDERAYKWGQGKEWIPPPHASIADLKAIRHLLDQVTKGT